MTSGHSPSNVYVHNEPIVPPHPQRESHHQAHHQRQSYVVRQQSVTSNDRYSVHSSQIIRQLFVGLYDYDARTNEDLSFKKGDKLTIIDNSQGEWWLAINDCQLQGYVPSNFLARFDSVATHSWYFGKIKRCDAERMLSSDENLHGAFLLRQSESRINDYALSVKDGDTVKHYRIRRTPTNLYYIAPKTPFHSLDKLIEHYSRTSNGLCTGLKRSCRRGSAPVTIDLAYSIKDRWEIDRRTLTMTHRLGSGNFAEVYEGLWNRSTPVAVKMLKNSLMSREQFLSEAGIMKNFNHRNLIRLYAICSVEEPTLIITELMVNGSLLSYLRNGKGKDLNEKQLIDIGGQIADGMAYLEEKKYIHRDLAARNSK